MFSNDAEFSLTRNVLLCSVPIALGFHLSVLLFAALVQVVEEIAEHQSLAKALVGVGWAIGSLVGFLVVKVMMNDEITTFAPLMLGASFGVNFWAVLLLMTRVLRDRMSIMYIYTEGVVEGGLVVMIPLTASAFAMITVAISFMF